MYMLCPSPCSGGEDISTEGQRGPLVARTLGTDRRERPAGEKENDKHEEVRKTIHYMRGRNRGGGGGGGGGGYQGRY